ncbi:MAG: hypothetical protein ABWZ25_15185 [Chitinophagaceae bacterium]
MRTLLVASMALLLSCQSQEGAITIVGEMECRIDSGSSGNSKKVASIASALVAHSSFLDSITRKEKLTIDQIRKHTMLDSIYYTGVFSDVVFTGDTVFDVHNGLKGAIINYSDKMSCTYKFLLILKADNYVNISNKIIYSDCDRDESFDYTFIRFKVRNDSIFETTETYIQANSELQQTKKVKWKIRDIGLIDTSR